MFFEYLFYSCKVHFERLDFVFCFLWALRTTWRRSLSKYLLVLSFAAGWQNPRFFSSIWFYFLLLYILFSLFHTPCIDSVVLEFIHIKETAWKDLRKKDEMLLIKYWDFNEITNCMGRLHFLWLGLKYAILNNLKSCDTPLLVMLCFWGFLRCMIGFFLCALCLFCY